MNSGFLDGFNVLIRMDLSEAMLDGTNRTQSCDTCLCTRTGLSNKELHGTFRILILYSCGLSRDTCPGDVRREDRILS